VVQAHDAAVSVDTWTVNDAEVTATLARLGVDSIATGFRAQMREMKAIS
jgi:glycerophosphoryl diester phosphodiesterase